MTDKKNNEQNQQEPNLIDVLRQGLDLLEKLSQADNKSATGNDAKQEQPEWIKQIADTLIEKQKELPGSSVILLFTEKSGEVNGTSLLVKGDGKDVHAAIKMAMKKSPGLKGLIQSAALETFIGG